jgi:dipeptidyl aminopeptidase/acylaminoacyl peptidase
MKSMGYTVLALCCALAFSPSSHAADPASPFQLTDVRKLASLSEPQVSPDGKRIAVIVSTPDWEADEDQQEIDLIDVATSTRRPLTWKRKELSMPRWSPDGTRLAFIADDPDTKKSQLFVMPMDGGDALRITETKPPSPKAARNRMTRFRSPTTTFWRARPCSPGIYG